MKNLIKIGCLFDPFFSGDSPISNDPTKSWGNNNWAHAECDYPIGQHV